MNKIHFDNKIILLRVVLCIVLILMCHLNVYASRKRVAGHFQVEMGGGALMFPMNQSEVGQQLAGAQIDLQAKYNYLFKAGEHWGLNIGLGIVSFAGAQTLNEVLLYNMVDDEGDPYTLIANVSNWYEKQRTLGITLPVGIFYQYKSRFSNVGFLTALNVKVSLPFYARYKVAIGDITTKGDYQQWGGTILEDLPQHGFGTRNDFHPSDKINTLMQVSLEWQIGALFPFENNTEMFVTGFAEYGFNNMFRPMINRSLFNSLNSYNGFYNSIYGKNTIPLIFGIKIGFRLLDIHGCNCIGY